MASYKSPPSLSDGGVLKSTVGVLKSTFGEE